MPNNSVAEQPASSGGPAASLQIASPSPLTTGQWLVLLAAFLGWMFDGLEMGIFPLVARPALQEMQTAANLLYEQFVQLWRGRITALFLLGAGTGGEWSLGVALVMECWPANKRPLMAGVIGAAANLGYALIAVIGLGFDITRGSWRWVMLVGAAPAVLTLLITLFVPESERWKAAVKNGLSRPVREIFSPALFKTTLLAIAFASVALIVTWGIVQWIPLWGDQMTHGQRPKVKAWIQMVSSICAILGCLIAPLLGAKFGRRPVYFGLCLGSLLACNVLFRGFAEYSGAFLLMVGLVGFCSASFYGWLPQYLPELFPTRVRATGQGLAFNFGRILAALGAWKMGALMAYFDKSYSKAGATIVLVYLLGMVLIWFAPETKGRPLPDLLIWQSRYLRR